MTAVPAGWRVARLGDVAETALGKMLDAARPRGVTRVPYLRNLNVQWGRIDLDDVQEVLLNEDEKQRFALEPGDLLVCEGGDIGRAAIWRGGPRYMAYQKALHRVRSRGELDHSYLRYLLEHYASTGELRRRATGSTILHLPQRQLRELPIPLPTVAEQRLIAEILEDHLSRLDAGSKLLDGVAARSEMLGSASRQQVFEQLRDVYGTTPVLDVAAIANGQTPKGVLDLVNGERLPGNLPYFKVGDMNVGDGRWMTLARNYLAPEAAASVGLSVRPAGTVLIPKRGGAIATNKKRVLREAACYDLNTMGIVPRAQLDSLYLWHWLVSVDLATIADGSNVPQINAPQIRRLALPVPSLAEQQRAVQRLDQIDESLAMLNAAAVAALRRGAQLRRSLLAAAFTGRLTGRAADEETVQELADV